MNKFTTLTMICLVALFAAACKPTPAPVIEVAETNTRNICELSSSKNVAAAFLDTQKTLSNTVCWDNFEQHFDNLLTISSGDPNIRNKEFFAEFLKWSESQGIISKMQLKETYTRYFTDFFVSLPQNESNCKVGQNLAQFTKNLDVEMLNKQKGLLVALGNKEAFNKAKQDRDALILIVAAAGEACQV